VEVKRMATVGDVLTRRTLVPSLLFVLSMADLAITISLVGPVYYESNPIAAWLLGQSTATAVACKVLGTAAACAIVYLGWVYRPVRIAAWCTLGWYTMLVVYSISLLGR
jgi:hypothetical protein